MAGVVSRPPCTHCGATEDQLGLAEVWPEERAFLPSTCCDGAAEDLQQWLEEAARSVPGSATSRAFADWFRAESGGMEARGLVLGQGTVRLDWMLRVVPVTWQVARQFVADHHSHHKPPVGWRWGLGVMNGPDLVAVCMVGRPVARALDGTQVVEVTRMAVHSSLEEADLARHACSMLYGASAREARRRGFSRIITYTLETEAATSVKAAGWDMEAKTRGGSWNCRSRARTDKAPTCPKVRWGRAL